jgi:hypothetical protein
MAMKSRPSWSPGALARVRKVGDKAFVAFLEEVSPAGTQPLIGHLPPVKGFRKGTLAGITHQKRALAGKFTAKSGVPLADRTRADAALYAFWRAWGREHLGDPAQLGKVLGDIEDAFENGLDEHEEASIGAQVDRLFLALKDASMENRCSREQIERFFLFSPFESSVTVESAIAGAKSAKDVARDVELHGLPDRLHQDEQDLRSLEERLTSLTALLDIATADIQELQHRGAAEPDDHGPALSGISTRLDDLGAGVSKALKGLETALAGVAELRNDLSDTVKAFSERLDGVTKSISSLSEGNETGLQAQALRVDELETLFLVLQHEVADQPRATALAVPHETAGAPPPLARAPTVGLFVEPLDSGSGARTVELVAWGPAYDLLCQNLINLGLKRSAGETLSREICAAVTGRYLMQFKGSFATPLARVAALSLFGEAAGRLPLPLGTIGWRDLDVALAARSAGNDPRQRGVVLEGLNNVPVESVADLLRDYLQGQIRPRTTLFASLNSGPSALPPSTQMLELGPIIDLDMLDWRLTRPNGGDIRIGQVSSALASDDFTANPGNRDELLDLLREHAKRNPLMASVAVGFHAHLNGHCDNPVAALQGTVFGWLWPLWAISGANAESIDAATEGGRLGATQQDPRFVTMLAELTTGRGASR